MNQIIQDGAMQVGWPARAAKAFSKSGFLSTQTLAPGASAGV